MTNQEYKLTQNDIARYFNITLHHQIDLLVESYVQHEAISVLFFEKKVEKSIEIHKSLYFDSMNLVIYRLLIDKGSKAATISRVLNRMITSSIYEGERLVSIKNMKKRLNKIINVDHKRSIDVAEYFRHGSGAHLLFKSTDDLSYIKSLLFDGYKFNVDFMNDFLNFLHDLYEVLDLKHDFLNYHALSKRIEDLKTLYKLSKSH